jgi:hypothetical protein
MKAANFQWFSIVVSLTIVGDTTPFAVFVRIVDIEELSRDIQIQKIRK